MLLPEFVCVYVCDVYVREKERLDRLSQLIPNLCSEISSCIGSAGQSKASQNIIFFFLSYVVFVFLIIL